MSRPLRSVLNSANPNNLPGAFQAQRVGDMLSRVVRFRRVAVASNKIILPDNAKAEQVLNCWVTAGTVSGRFSPVYDSTPATTQVSTNAQGDIVFLSTDAVTECEISYLAFEGNVYEETIVCVASLATFGASRRALCVLEAEALTATIAGVKTVDDRATAPATLHAALNLLGTGCLFNNATDVVTKARVKYIATPGFGDQLPPLGLTLDTGVEF